MDTGCAKEFSEIRWLLIFQGASTSSHVRKLSTTINIFRRWDMRLGFEEGSS